RSAGFLPPRGERADRGQDEMGERHAEDPDNAHSHGGPNLVQRRPKHKPHGRAAWARRAWVGPTSDDECARAGSTLAHVTEVTTRDEHVQVRGVAPWRSARPEVG